MALRRDRWPDLPSFPAVGAPPTKQNSEGPSRPGVLPTWGGAGRGADPGAPSARVTRQVRSPRGALFGIEVLDLWYSHFLRLAVFWESRGGPTQGVHLESLSRTQAAKDAMAIVATQMSAQRS